MLNSKMKKIAVSEITFLCDLDLNKSQIDTIFNEKNYFSVKHLSLYSIIDDFFIENFVKKGKVEILPFGNDHEAFYFSLTNGNLLIEFSEKYKSYINYNHFKKFATKKIVSYKQEFDLLCDLDKLQKIFTDFIKPNVPPLSCLVCFEPKPEFFKPEQIPHSISLPSFLDPENFLAHKYEVEKVKLDPASTKWPMLIDESQDNYDLILDYFTRLVFCARNSTTLENINDNHVKIDDVSRTGTVLTFRGCFSSSKTEQIVSRFRNVCVQNSNIDAVFVLNDLFQINTEVTFQKSQINLTSSYNTRSRIP